MYDLDFMRRGVYWQSWSSKWTSDPTKFDLVTDLDPNANIVYLAFANPNSTYTKGQKTWATTGLDFSSDFGVVAEAIKIIRSKNVVVMLSVGGATYLFGATSAQPLVDLAQDLGCDGIDLDWEPANGVAAEDEFGPLIAKYRAAWPKGILSAACFSTGSYGKNGDTFQGMNIKGLVSNGSDLNYINIMAYDAGSTYDPLGAFMCYRMYYKGPIHLGFEPGQMAWGGYLITAADVTKACRYVQNESSNNGIFVWSAQKDATGSPTVAWILACAVSTMGSTPPDPPLPSTGPLAMPIADPINLNPSPVAVTFDCPHCKYKLNLSVS